MTFCLTSCSDSKIAQCQKIADISQKISQQAETSRHTQDSEKVRQTAEKFAAVAQELDQLSLNDTTLQSYKKGLAEVYRGYSRATFLMLDAIKNRDIKSAKLAKQEVMLNSKNEQSIGQNITTYCQPSG